MDPLESAARATATAGGAVVFAGGTVIIALLSLLVAGIPIVTSLGYTSAIVVALAMLAAITLLPAMLGLLRHRINSGRVTGNTGAPATDTGAWHRWAELVSRHPWIAIVAALAMLLVLAIPTLSLDLGQTDDAAAAKGTETRESYDAITAGYGAGLNGPLLVAVDLSKPATNDQAQLQTFNQQQTQQQQAVQAGTGAGAEPAGPGQRAAAEDFLESKASDPRLVSLHDAIAKTADVQSVSAGQRQRRRHRGRLPRDLEERAVLRRDRHPRGHPARQRAAGRPPRARA